MNDRNAPRLKKWPFYLADVALVGLAVWVLNHYPHPLAGWAATLIIACVVVAALLAVWPFRLEYDTDVRLFESSRVTTAAEAIRNLEDTARQIQQATGQWQSVQEISGKTAQAARDIADRMTAEARAFSEFMAKANDSEKSTMRLEIEKLRRNEGQWLQVLVHTLDHVHALYQAGSRSGQPNLAAQLGAFQAACRDLARRVGLVAIDAEVDQPFDSAQHEPVQGQPQPDGPAHVAQVVAAGFSFQGQILRRPVVALKAAPDAEANPTEESLPTNALGETPAANDELGVVPPEFVSTDASDSEAATLVTETSGETGEEVVTDLADVLATEASGVTEIAEVTGVPSGDSDPEISTVEDFRLESDPVEDERERRRAGNG
jgi:molecular chaperone GrpE (heat shock protein)